MTLMWEARAADGRFEELLGWVTEHAPPAAGVYRSAQARIVVIDESDAGLPDPPAELVCRPAHTWHFTPVER